VAAGAAPRERSPDAHQQAPDDVHLDARRP
jgi:hypothetical protein